MVQATELGTLSPVDKWYSLYIQCTNFSDKTVKLWKVYDKSVKTVAVGNVQSDKGTVPNNNTLKLPKLVHHDSMTVAIPRRIYQNAHTYHINSLSVNSDGETFLSADDLRINLWNLNISDQSFSMTTFFALQEILLISSQQTLRSCQRSSQSLNSILHNATCLPMLAVKDQSK